MNLNSPKDPLKLVETFECEVVPVRLNILFDAQDNVHSSMMTVSQG